MDQESYYHDDGYYSNGYHDDGYPEEMVYYEDTQGTTLHYCILPVLAQVTAVFLKVFGLAALVGIFTQLQSEKLTLIMDTLLGLLCAYLFYDTSIIFIALLVMLSYGTLVLFAASGRCGAAILLVNLAFVFLCELVLVEAERWHQIRGTIILLLMKTTSGGFDIDAGVITPPSSLLFSAYTLSPVSLVFGPFVTLPHYRRSKHAKYDRRVFLCICSSLSLAYLSVLISTCILPGFVESSSGTLVRAYLTAQSFRTSHYFVSYTSQVAALIGGLQQSDKFTVVDPVKIELPRSMASVAVAWNLPMHHWLKTYIYKKSRSCGVFVAAFLTYAASSVLHGLNFQLPAVLISIFMFSYVEAELRDELATLVDCCVRVQKCSGCQHSNKVFTVPITVACVLLNITQLTYLGVMFDSDPTQVEGYSWWNAVTKWSNLCWYGHVVCGTSFLLTYLLRYINTRLARQHIKRE